MSLAPLEWRLHHERTIVALVAGVLLGSTGIAAATSHTASNAITYAGIRCVTARETAAVVCSRVTNTGYTASMSKGFITVWRNGGSYQLAFQRRNR
jgi:uncharacterized membrane protein YtjA (UPF0391 family)